MAIYFGYGLYQELCSIAKTHIPEVLGLRLLQIFQCWESIMFLVVLFNYKFAVFLPQAEKKFGYP